MAAIPAISDFTDAAVTEGEFKTALAGLHDYLTGQLGTAGTQAAAQAALGAILGAGVSTRTTAYTVVEADRGKIIACTGTFSLSLTAASTLGAGFAVAVANVGSGSITIDPNGTETIDAATTYVVPANTTALIACTGSAWVVVSGNPFAKVTGTPNGTKFLRDDLSWQTVTVPDVMATIAAASAGGVGTYVYANGNASIAFGNTVAGSNLTPTSAHWAQADSPAGLFSFPQGAALSGTWRAMGTYTYSFRNTGLSGPLYFGATLFLRIS